MEREKYVDESWKESAELEKEKLKSIQASTRPAASAASTQPPSEAASAQAPANTENFPPEETQSSESDIDFINYLSSLAYQAMVFLGEIPNPMTNMPEINIDQAKFIIDTIIMLREKTKGNLTKKENDILGASIYQLQMKYMEARQREGVV